MTTSVSGVSTQTTQAAAAQSPREKSDLSESTKRQLEALGIPVTDGMTEAQAQAKIQQVQKEEAAQNGEGQNLTETEVLADAKSLASRVGVSYGDDETADEILSKISDELDAMIDEAGEDPQQINTILEYYRELKNLDDQYDNIQAAQESMYAAMNMVSTNNKIALGLE